MSNEEEAEQRLMDEKKKEIRQLNQKLTALKAQQKRGSNGFDAAEWNRRIVSRSPDQTRRSYPLTVSSESKSTSYAKIRRSKTRSPTISQESSTSGNAVVPKNTRVL